MFILKPKVQESMVVDKPAVNGQQVTVTILSIQGHSVKLSLQMKDDVTLSQREDWERSQSSSGVKKDGTALRPIAEILFATWPRWNLQPLTRALPAVPEGEEVATDD